MITICYVKALFNLLVPNWFEKHRNWNLFFFRKNPSISFCLVGCFFFTQLQFKLDEIVALFLWIWAFARCAAVCVELLLLWTRSLVNGELVKWSVISISSRIYQISSAQLDSCSDIVYILLTNQIIRHFPSMNLWNGINTTSYHHVDWVKLNTLLLSHHDLRIKYKMLYVIC